MSEISVFSQSANNSTEHSRRARGEFLETEEEVEIKKIEVGLVILCQLGCSPARERTPFPGDHIQLEDLCGDGKTKPSGKTVVRRADCKSVKHRHSSFCLGWANPVSHLLSSAPMLALRSTIVCQKARYSPEVLTQKPDRLSETAIRLNCSVKRAKDKSSVFCCFCFFPSTGSSLLRQQKQSNNEVNENQLPRTDNRSCNKIFVLPKVIDKEAPCLTQKDIPCHCVEDTPDLDREWFTLFSNFLGLCTKHDLRFPD